MHYGSTAEVVRDVHKVQRTQNRLRKDKRDVREARRELQRDRWGY
jgi:RNA polymerase-interacting CarD/CdnL/TRCF family regulator